MDGEIVERFYALAKRYVEKAGLPEMGVTLSEEEEVEMGGV